MRCVDLLYKTLVLARHTDSSGHWRSYLSTQFPLPEPRNVGVHNWPPCLQIGPGRIHGVFHVLSELPRQVIVSATVSVIVSVTTTTTTTFIIYRCDI